MLRMLNGEARKHGMRPARRNQLRGRGYMIKSWPEITSGSSTNWVVKFQPGGSQNFGSFMPVFTVTSLQDSLV